MVDIEIEIKEDNICWPKLYYGCANFPFIVVSNI